MALRMYAPLTADHHLVTDKKKCPLCDKRFAIGERVTLLAAQPEHASVVQAAPTHARCAFKGAKTRQGEIVTIMDGDASPYPVVTSMGQFKPEEVGIKT